MLGQRMAPVKNTLKVTKPELGMITKLELAPVTLGLRLCKMSVSEQGLLNFPRKELSMMSFLYQQQVTH